MKKIANILKHKYASEFLCFACVFLIILFTIQTKFSIDPLLSIILYIVAAIIISSGTILTIFLILKDISKNEYEQKMELCRTCAKDTSKYQFANFDFITFNDLLEIEGSLKNDANPKNCFVYVYTSNLSTEEDAEKEVVENRKAGVIYRVFYIDGNPSKEIIELYGDENLFQCTASEIDRAADFDIMIYIDSHKNTNGFFCVNFSKVEGPRPCSQGYPCNNTCHYDNQNLLYKKIRKDTVDLILQSLHKMEDVKIEK